VIRATRVLVAVAFGYLLFGISGEQFMALQESYAWSIGESINNEVQRCDDKKDLIL
jgi:hypothetical protein